MPVCFRNVKQILIYKLIKLNYFLVITFKSDSKYPAISFGIGTLVGVMIYLSVIFSFLNPEISVKNYWKSTENSTWHPLELDKIEAILNQTRDPRSDDILFDQIKIVCVVVGDTFNKLRAEEIRKTWGQRCNKLAFANKEEG